MRPQVGVGILLFHRSKILLGKRINTHGEGCWSPPGGYLEYGESVEHAAQRELLEETGLVVEHFRKGPWTNNIFADHQSGTPQVIEPDKCEVWEWFELDRLPKP